jgi:MoaA/NifB/PqqE/SkfB family radical SAM enzyme
METENLVQVRLPEESASIEIVKRKISRSCIISGRQKDLVHLKLLFSLIKIAWECYGNPVDVVRGIRFLRSLRKKFIGNFRLKKMVQVDGIYYLYLYNPGWRSDTFRKFMISQLNDFKPVRRDTYRFNNVIMAITKKCALQCDHCFEWESLNKRESLSTEELIEIVQKLQKQGVSEIQFSGGEPLLKVDRIIEILNSADKTATTFWIDTSGFKFTQENAGLLKEAGLTGVFVSLDHFDPDQHNRFRGFKDAFYWAETAVNNALEQGFVVALNLCITREFASRENLTAYMEMAAKMGVHFVQFIEPKAVGHFKGKDVLLLPEHLELVEEIYTEFNFSSNYLSYPVITYHGYYQRRNGCFSGGYKGFYMDTDGDVNPCPFCRKKTGNLLEDDPEETLRSLNDSGCMDYSRFS